VAWFSRWAKRSEQHPVCPCLIEEVQAATDQPHSVTPHFLRRHSSNASLQQRSVFEKASSWETLDEAKNAESNASLSRNATVPYEPHLPRARLKARRMITVKDAATGSRDRSRCNTSAASTSVRESLRGQQGWGGGISCGCSDLCLLTEETSLLQSGFFPTPIDYPTILKPSTSVSHCCMSR
jgi:hypothetical protein